MMQRVIIAAFAYALLRYEKRNFLHNGFERKVQELPDKRAMSRGMSERMFWQWSTLISFLTMLGAGATAIAAILAWHEARRQTIDADRQANAATRSYVYGRFVNPIGERLWIHSYGEGLAKQTEVTGSPSDTQSPEFELTNYGQSPAILSNVQCGSVYGEPSSVNFESLSVFMEKPQNFAERTALAKEPIKVSCGPPWPANPEIINLDKINRSEELSVAIHSHPIWLLATVQYEEITGEVKSIKYCARLEDGYYADINSPLAFIPAKPPDCILSE